MKNGLSRLVLCCFLATSASCSQYDWSPDDLLYASPSAPIINFGADLVLTDADNLDLAYILPVTISDPNTPMSALTVTWSGSASDPAPVSIVYQSGNYTALFPRNGVYQLSVSVDDGTSVSQDSLIITVNAARQFSIDGDVHDNLSAVQGAAVVLRFADGTLIESQTSSASGQFTFANLIGGLVNYEVVVQ